MNPAERQSPPPPTPIPGRIPSQQTQALIEAGKASILDSLTIGRDFCASMRDFSIGAIAVYTALLALIYGSTVLTNHPIMSWLGLPTGLILAIPAILYIVAAAIFAWGLLPHVGYISLDEPESVRSFRAEAITRSQKFMKWGFGAFAMASLAAVAVIVAVFTTPLPPPPAA